MLKSQNTKDKKKVWLRNNYPRAIEIQRINITSEIINSSDKNTSIVFHKLTEDV